jgi:integrase
VKKSTWAPSYGGRVLSRLEQDVFPEIGTRPAEQLTAPEILALLRQVEARGVYETAKRLRQTISQIFRYAVATGQAERDPAADLRGALRSPGRSKRHARLEPEDLPEFFGRLAVYDGQRQTALGIELIAHTFVRTKELRFARQTEFKLDVDETIWRIPGDRMKVKRGDHIVPLTTQSVSVVCELISIAGDSDWL